MKDEVVGLCVLCPMDLGDGEYFLYLTERRADGAEFRRDDISWMNGYFIW